METSTLSSRGYFLWNNTSGFELGGLEADTTVPVASLTKIMTALVTLEHRQLDENVTITTPMLENLEEFATIDLEVGDIVSVEELLYATLLPSAGDAAQALAISTSGSVTAFAELMNARAEELRMQNNHFSNPVGLDNNNYSTPRDIATLLRAALQNPTFREMFTTFERPLPSLGLTVYKTFSRSAYLQGGKTGFTNATGRCLASIAVNFLIFHSWFTSAVAPEVNHLTASSSSADSDPNASSTPDESTFSIPSDPGLASSNCTTSSGILMLINPNFTVDENFIQSRRDQLISVSQTYGIPEYHPEGNGDNLMIPEAAAHLNDMLAAYRAEFPGHEMGTYSCFRARGTSCGRLCAATGTTGLFETWHYRYVGIPAATEIATGKYNNGAYDSLEHYLKSTGRVADLKAATCP